MCNDEDIAAITARLLLRLAAGRHDRMVPSVADVFDQPIEAFSDLIR